MGWLAKLHGTIVGLDTAPLIYFVEEHPAYLPIVDPFFEAMGRGEFQTVTSTLTLTEVLVHPYRRSDRYLLRQYSNMLLRTRNLVTVPVTPEIADEAARIRAAYGTKTPDSVQLATARLSGATSFLANDAALPAIPGLELLLLDRLVAAP